MIRNLIFLTLITLSLCTRSGDNDELSYYRDKWHSRHIKNYDFTMQVTCFCTDERAGPHEIKVIDGVIGSVNGMPYDPAKTGELMTIDQLFSYIEKSIARDPYYQSVEYDREYGFPENVYFDFYRDMADEETGFRITDFKAN